MNKKTRKILIYVFIAVIVAALMFVAATNARYVSLQSPATGSVVSEPLQYTVADQYVVTSQTDLEEAIENGYTNIKIDSDEDEPFYVSSDDLELTGDLILDLNGHEIQCVTREPIITVGTGTDQNGKTVIYRLLVTDTSSEGNGSFYNPVGSVLNVKGGVLSASGGNYESGPRKSEYYSNINAADYTGGYLLSDQSLTVNCLRTTSGATTSGTQQLTMPVLYPNGSSGNIYFDSDYNANIPADTYL